MQSKNFDIEILKLNHVPLLLDYYSSNKEHLEIWHPTTPEGFYTLEYQTNKVKERINLIKEGKSIHFLMFDKSNNKMIGHCNYTKIENHKCWVGCSISKFYQGKSLMYEALKLTNASVMDKLNIKEIRAGILPHNERSIRLIKRLNFKYVDEKDRLEINGKMWIYDTYLLASHV